MLRRGDRFRASGGPLWRKDDGQKTSIAARGPFVFLEHCQRGKLEWIEALDKNGSFAALHIAGRRRKISPQIVTRPYRIKGRVRKRLTRARLAS